MNRLRYDVVYASGIAAASVYFCDGVNYVADNTHLVLLPKNKFYSYSIAETGPCVMAEFDSDVVFTDFATYSIRDDKAVSRLAVKTSP